MGPPKGEESIEDRRVYSPRSRRERERVILADIKGFGLETVAMSESRKGLGWGMARSEVMNGRLMVMFASDMSLLLSRRSSRRSSLRSSSNLTCRL